MKRTIAIIIILAVVLVVAIFSYLIGHRHGVVHADTRSTLFELQAFEGFEKQGADSAKTRFGNLINFREDNLNTGFFAIDDWNYWRQVRWDEARKNIMIRLKSVSNQLPQRKTVEQMQSEIDKHQSEPQR